MNLTPEIRELRYFMAVAEERHFGRAAARLGIAQPALSRAIRGLESRLGVALLERTTRHVAPTAAGRVLAEEARAVIAAAERAAERARRAAAAEERLVVAVKADGDGGLLRPILDAFPGEADILLGGWGEQADQVRDGRADVALVHLPFDTTGLEYDVLAREPRLVALASTHPLATRPHLTLDDLAGEPLPRWTGPPDDEVAQLWCASEPEAGRGRRIGVPEPRALDRPPVADVSQALALVALGRVVAFVPASVAERHRRPELTFRPVEGLTPIRLAIAWSQTSRSHTITDFIRTATAVADDVPALRAV